MIITYQLAGIGRKIIQLLLLVTLSVLLYTLFLLFSSHGQDYFLIFIVFVVGLILKYLQGYLVYRIQIDVENKTILLKRTLGEILVSSKDVREWGYRLILIEAEYISRSKNLEIYLDNSNKIVYPFNLFGTSPSDEFKQAMIDCLGSTPKTYAMKTFTLQSDVLFVLL